MPVTGRWVQPPTGSPSKIDMGVRALKVLNVLLCGINAAVWLLYTESTMMAALWAATAIGFIIWIASDVRNG